MTLGDRILIPGLFHLMASRKACYWRGLALLARRPNLKVIILVVVGTVMPVMEFLVRTIVVGVPP